MDKGSIDSCMPISSKRLTFALAFLAALAVLFGPCAPELEDGRSEATRGASGSPEAPK